MRVWNDPYNSVTRLGYGAGNTDAAAALEIGERATEAGLKVLVDFHYSDFWADPGKQKAPKAWASCTLAQKATATHDFTATTLQAMEDAGVNVGMVQVGNETNGAVAGVTGMPEHGADLLRRFGRGARGLPVRARRAALHQPGDVRGATRVTPRRCRRAGVDYDVFASSYYPYWHGTSRT